MLQTFLASLLVSLFTLAPLAVLAQDAAPSPASASRDVGIVYFNAASQAELEALPGIGPKTAQRILEYRQKSGATVRDGDLPPISRLTKVDTLAERTTISVAASEQRASAAHRANVLAPVLDAAVTASANRYTNGATIRGLPGRSAEMTYFGS